MVTLVIVMVPNYGIELNTNIHNHSINYLGVGHSVISVKISHIYKIINVFQWLKHLYLDDTDEIELEHQMQQ